MRPRALGLALAAAMGLAGCGGSGSATRSSPTRASTPTSGPPAPVHRTRTRDRASAGPSVGATQSVHADGAHLTVTVPRVIDPLTATGSPSLPGTRQVGVALRIANQAGATYDSTASGDVSVVVSSGRTAPLYVRSGVCQTPLTDFESLIGSGAVRSGCVAFSVPRHARLLAVRFSPHARATGSVTWRIGSYE